MGSLVKHLRTKSHRHLFAYDPLSQEEVLQMNMYKWFDDEPPTLSPN